MTEREQFDQWLVEANAKPGKMPTRWETWQAARAVQPQVVVEPGILKLARFGSLMLSKHRNGGYPGSIDGDDAQAAAEASGCIEPRSVAEPCGESCSCAEMMMPEDWPATCYSIPDDVIKARAAMSPPSDVVGSGEAT